MKTKELEDPNVPLYLQDPNKKFTSQNNIPNNQKEGFISSLLNSKNSKRRFIGAGLLTFAAVFGGGAVIIDGVNKDNEIKKKQKFIEDNYTQPNETARGIKGVNSVDLGFDVDAILLSDKAKEFEIYASDPTRFIYKDIIGGDIKNPNGILQYFVNIQELSNCCEKLNTLFPESNKDKFLVKERVDTTLKENSTAEVPMKGYLWKNYSFPNSKAKYPSRAIINMGGTGDNLKFDPNGALVEPLTEKEMNSALSEKYGVVIMVEGIDRVLGTVPMQDGFFPGIAGSGFKDVWIEQLLLQGMTQSIIKDYKTFVTNVNTNTLDYVGSSEKALSGTKLAKKLNKVISVNGIRELVALSSDRVNASLFLPYRESIKKLSNDSKKDALYLSRKLTSNDMEVFNNSNKIIDIGSKNIQVGSVVEGLYNYVDAKSTQLQLKIYPNQNGNTNAAESSVQSLKEYLSTM